MTSYGGVCHEEEVPEGQIAFALKQAEMETPVVEVIRKVGITVQNYVGRSGRVQVHRDLWNPTE